MTRQEFLDGFHQWIHNFNRNPTKDATEYYYNFINRELSPNVDELPSGVFNCLVKIILREEETFPKRKTCEKYIQQAWNRYIQQKAQDKVIPGTLCALCKCSGWVSDSQGNAKPCRCEEGASKREWCVKNGVEWRISDEDWVKLTEFKPFDKVIEETFTLLEKAQGPLKDHLFKIYEKLLENSPGKAA